MTQQSTTDDRPDLAVETDNRRGEVAEELGRQAKDVSEKVREKAVEAAERTKDSLSEELRSIAGKLEDLEEKSGGPRRLAPFTSYVARNARRAAAALENRSAEQIAEIMKSGVRERPVAAMMAMLAIGFLGGRLSRR